jgi:protein-S-isoprenylcysteine O-methyltransferase Ste14
MRARAVRTFRVARPTSRRRLAAKTGGQIVVVWGFALVVLPAVAARVEQRLGLPRLRRRGRIPLGLSLLVAGSATGLASAWFMAEEGKGTPIPFDAASRLVVVGPYRIVRNPMAVSAIAQSTGVALLLGSPLAGLIPASGAVLWNRLIRPAEEDFLAEQFGDDYHRYQDRVRCWVPTWPPYRP